MSNHSIREQETLSGDLLALVEQSRQPALGKLDDSALLALIASLDRARTEAEAANDPDTAGLLRTATRRAQNERRNRGLRSPLRPAAAAVAPPAPAVLSKPARAEPGVKRKGATIPRKPAGRKPAEARKTDLRTEPHRMPKRREKPAETPEADLPPETVAQTTGMIDTAAEHPAGQAANKVRTDASVTSDKDMAKAARKAEKQKASDAEKDAAKIAKVAQKEAAKVERKAARKAEKQAEKAAEKEARRAERKAAEAPVKDAGKSAGKADGPGDRKPGSGKSKSGKPKGRKDKTDKRDS